MTGAPWLNDGGARRMRRAVSRRSFMKAGLALGAAGAVGTLHPRHARLIEAALASDQAPAGSLSDIEHVVILMQENRSFDHYFGTLSDVRGYSDPDVPVQDVSGVRTPVFDQYGPAGYRVGGDPYLQPFELRSNFPNQPGQTTDDITHDWGPQHASWNNGAMDQFLKAHLAVDGTDIGFLTMGYFTGNDLPFYYALADAFTVCDAYHCSVLGPTYPNRLMQMSGSLGASGAQGGPVLETYSDPVQYYGTMDWPTYPEALTEGGVSWKVYQDPTTTVLYNVLPFFKNFTSPATSTDAHNAANGLSPQYPAEFVADVAAGTLPQVSWILPPAACCEHPAAPPEYGEWLVAQILQTLVSNPDVWAKTAFFVIYDENGGFFDHVPPVTPGPMALAPSEIPTGDEYVGEYVTAPLPSSGTYSEYGQTLNVYGPVGLGFRTPALVISPFSRGGYLCSETFDHISVLKFIESRFGVAIPNVSPWRYGTVGDMTSALALSLPPDTEVPALPPTSLLDPEVAAQAVVDAFAGTEDHAPLPYPAPTANRGIPAQQSSPTRTRLPSTGSAASGGPQPAVAPATGARPGGVQGNGPAGASPGPSSRSTRSGAAVAASPSGGSRPARRTLKELAPSSFRADGPLAGESAVAGAAVGVTGWWLRRITRRAPDAAAAPTGPESQTTVPLD